VRIKASWIAPSVLVLSVGLLLVATLKESIFGEGQRSAVPERPEPPGMNASGAATTRSSTAPTITPSSPPATAAVAPPIPVPSEQPAPPPAPSVAAPSAPARAGGPPVVTIYGTSWCGACKAARQYFSSHNIPFADKDIERDADAARELAAKASKMGIPTDRVPVIDVRGRLLLGFDRARIETLLGEPT